jgi:hypothetical protein
MHRISPRRIVGHGDAIEVWREIPQPQVDVELALSGGVFPTMRGSGEVAAFTIPLSSRKVTAPSGICSAPTEPKEGSGTLSHGQMHSRFQL